MYTTIMRIRLKGPLVQDQYALHSMATVKSCVHSEIFEKDDNNSRNRSTSSALVVHTTSECNREKFTGAHNWIGPNRLFSITSSSLHPCLSIRMHDILQGQLKRNYLCIDRQKILKVGFGWQ